MDPLIGGLETGGTWCVCALGRGPDQLEALEQFPTTGPEETLERVLEFFSQRRRPVALGIGAFGPVDLDPASPTWGYVTTTPKPGWRRTALASVLRDRLDVPVAFDTDVSAAAIGEYRWGAGEGAGSLCYATVGTGIGIGLLLQGVPVHGLVHPEAGHMRVPHDHRADPFAGVCPSHGDCWEGLASGHAVAQRWGARPEDLPDEHPAWELEARYLALGLYNILCTVSPERIVLGGGVMERDGLISQVRQGVQELIGGYLEDPMLDVQIDRYLVTPRLGDRAGVLGAIALAQLAFAPAGDH
ncbi:MAG: ROK family protein [Solirubrobacteraceae bacterium]